ncbi:PH domain-containing protein [Psychrobacter sp. I-STPA6b]|uniref:PH domain-containing protein n=1 Tax=Psychrobacter sp. I-STPA6b TaxID=2585718 RepID=UPI001D0C1ECB|nr:PH domain-containing protein [Psychrobacter sp. I-STPA6b]
MSIANSTETVIWQGKPSHFLNLKAYIFCVLFFWLIFPLFILLWKIIQLKSTKYTLTNQRLQIKTGVFSQQFDELELYRVKDIRYERPFLLRLVGRGNLTLFTSDATDSLIILQAICQGEQLRQQIRNLVETRRSNRRVQEIDMFNG